MKIVFFRKGTFFLNTKTSFSRKWLIFIICFFSKNSSKRYRKILTCRARNARLGCEMINLNFLFFLVLITETLRIIKRQFCFVILSREKYIYSFIYMFSQHRVPKEVHPKTFPSSLSFLFVRLMLSLLRLEWKKSKQKCDRNVVSEKNPQRL